MEQAGIKFETMVSTVEERITKSMPAEVVSELSWQKAQNVAEKVRNSGDDDCLVIGADTIVTIDGRIMGKPEDAQHAKEMLRILAGREHQVFTGVTFVLQKDGKERSLTFFEETKVFFYPMSEAEIDDYIATGEPVGKAGSYGIQGKSAVFIRKIEGDYNNVVGLPLSRVYQEMKRMGLNLKE